MSMGLKIMHACFIVHAWILIDGVAAADCIDEAARARLAEDKRLRRAGEERDFLQAGRHELTLSAGYYVADMFDGAPTVAGGYAYHLTEALAVDASFGWTRFRSSVAAQLEADRGVTVLPREDRVLLLFTDLVLAPLHGKAQIFADAVVHFDIYGSLGVGIVDNSTSLGAATRAGVGIKAYLGPAFAIRLDVYDHVYRQQVLETPQWVQDFAVSLGLSLYLPWRP
jgi:outer membrane beta-barrel protein